MKNVHRQAKAVSLIALSFGCSLLFGASAANAADRQLGTQRFTEYADVIDVNPVYKNIRVREPRQECWIETQQHIIGYESPRYERHQANGRRNTSTNRSNAGSALVGGIIGGVIGNQLGRGHSSNSRAGATIAGAIIGGAVANESRSGNSIRDRRQRTRSVERRGAPIYGTQEVQRCKEVSESRIEQRIQHYDVTYRYKGRTFQTRMKRDPGRQLELQVNVAPARQ